MAIDVQGRGVNRALKMLVCRLVSGLEDARNERAIMITLLVVAFAARMAFAMLLPNQAAALPDSIAYRAAASDLATGRLLANDFMMPGYPLLVALVGGGAGQVIADILLSVVSVWCVARIVREIGGDALSAIAAGFIWALYPFSLFYAAVGLTETLFVTLLLLGFLAFYRNAIWLGSAAMVLSILTRPAVEMLAPLLIVAFAVVVHRRGWRRALGHVTVFAAVYAMMMSPWWWHNAEKYGQFVRLNLASGYVLYSGNNPMNRSGGGIGMIDVDPGKFNDIADPVARDKAFTKAAIDFIAKNPGRTLELMWQKLLRLWRPWPYATEYVKPSLIVISVVTIVPLMFLAVAGFVQAIVERRWRPLIPIVMFIGFTTAVHMVTIASMRYRFPMEPFLVILAAPMVGYVIKAYAAPRDLESTKAASA